MNNTIKSTIMITIGSLILAFGGYFFLINNGIAAGGVTGISMIASEFLPIMTTGQWSLVLNIFLFVLAFWLIGKKFGISSMYSSGIVSLSIIIFEKIFPNGVTLTEDMILNVTMGAVIQAVGMGIVFFYEGSTGGTDILAVILNKYSHISVGNSLLIIDVLVIVLAAISFGIDKALYATLTILITSPLIDYMIQGLGRKIQMMIISDKVDEINNLILKDYDRGVTLLHAEGGYSGRDKRIILTVLTRRQYLDLRSDVEKIDDKAFIFTNYISEIYGEGFTFDKL